MFDYAIRNGLVVDGTRKKPYQATVYLKDGKIAEISADNPQKAAVEIDASGRVVSPGFIDIHTHSDFSYLATPVHEGKLRGGVTFELVGQCGISAVPLRKHNMAKTLRNVADSFGIKL
jgi:N-acyl-D-amino-acid deacylase